MKSLMRSDRQWFRRPVLLGLAAIACCPSPLQAAARWHPTRPVTLIVPFLAGGGTDIAARMLATGLGRMWNVPVRVDNLTGVAGTVGANAVAHAPPDGHTLLIGTLGTQAINPLLYKSMPYQPELAFAPVSLIARWPMVLVVRPDERARTIQGLIAW